MKPLKLRYIQTISKCCVPKYGMLDANYAVVKCD